MLKQRVMTGLVLGLALLAAVLLLSTTVLAYVFGAVVLIAAWEWAALAGLQQRWARLAYPLLMAVSLLLINWYTTVLTDPNWQNAGSILGLAGLWWALALFWVKHYPASAGLWGKPLACSVMGIAVLAPAWLGLVCLRLQPDGALTVLYVFLIVICADTGAYFTGRAWGKHKLAPLVSPGKTVEGVLGGLLLVLVLGVAVGLTKEMSGSHIAVLLVITLLTGMVSVLGDLVESMVKRHADVKDSSHLLPGHGGVLDRIDSITAAAPVFALCLIFVRYSG